MITDQGIITALWKYGYLPGTPAVELADLKLSSLLVEEALAKYQDFCRYPLDSMVRRHHRRGLVADGLAGPATRELFSTPRCEVPDFGPGSGRELAGSGSWPMPCQKAGVKIHFDWSGAPSAVLAKKEQYKQQILECFRLAGLKLIEVSSASLANIRVFFGGFFGGTIGLAQFNGENCDDVVTCKLSSSYVWQDIGLPKHEIGHNDNLPHTSGGTMNPYILREEDPAGRWLPSDPSWGRIVRFHDGVPVGEVPPDDQAPPDDPLPPPDDSPAPPPTTPWRFWDVIRDFIKRWF